MSNTLFIIIIAVLIIGFVVIISRLKGQGKEKPDNQALLMLQGQLAEISKTLDTKLNETRHEMRDAVKTQFTESQRLLRDINEQMHKSLVDVAKEQTKTNEATTRFMSIAEQLSNLEKVLTHQKNRGSLGEASLELILSNVLPPTAYKMQHEFLNKEKVDAVIITKDGLIPVDAKFSLDNYNRITQAIDDKQKEELEKEFKNDLKKRIDETAKYIRPDEGTLPFAFMFIPAEAIYYDLLVNEIGAVKVNTRNLIDYAYKDKKVIIVSPTTFAAYLQSVLYGFKAFKIEETAKDIIKRVDELGKHLKAYEDYMMKVGKSLGTTVNHYNVAYKELKKVDKDVYRISGAEESVDPLVLPPPSQDDENSN